MNQLSIENFSIDKSGWVKVTLGEVIYEPKETLKDAVAEGIEHVVGLEHIDSEDIHLRRSASIDGSTTFTKKFRQGDVLFGRRRAYLKKAAKAKFSGICSGDIIVFRAKNNLLSELLPFVINNEKFFDYAVKHSAGGLSPRVKFKDLCNYEFLLPPINQQVELKSLLCNLDEVYQHEKILLEKYKIFYKTYLNTSISEQAAEIKANNLDYLFGSLGEVYGGLNGKSKEDFGNGSPFITYMNVFKNTKINPNMVDYVEVAKGEKQNLVKFGDIIFTGSSETPDELGMTSVVLDNLDDHYLNSFCFGFRLHNFNYLLPEYARYFFQTDNIRDFMRKHAQGSTRFNLPKTVITKKLKINLPPIDIQKLIAEDLSNKESQIELLEQKLLQTKLLNNALIAEIF